VVALLSLGTDLGLGQPMEHMIRAALIALRLAEHLGLDASERRVVYYSGLLAWVGCHTDAYEQAKWMGDDLALKSDAHYAYDSGRAGPMVAFMLKHIGGSSRPLAQRLVIGAGFAGEGRRVLGALAENHYRATDALAERLGLGADVREGLRQTYERWDGRGAYGLLKDQSRISSRLINLADVTEVFRRLGGVRAATAVAMERRGTQFDPQLVDIFCELAPELFRDIDAAQSWDLVIESEPLLGEILPEDRFDEMLSAIGEFAELKSPWTMGHAHAVAQLVGEAGRAAGLRAYDVTTLRRAAWTQDLGRLGVPNTVWDKASALSAGELERVRLHPYLTERMLSYSPALAPVGMLAVLHHERLDGSGYPHGLTGNAIGMPGRILAAADVYAALVAPRPHRAAFPPAHAAAILRGEVTARRIDGEAVELVLQAAGQPRRLPREWPAGLTAREVEVLRLVTIGLSNKQIATRLNISAKTAGSHVEHIYMKIDATNRAQAGIFAMRHGLVFPSDT